MVCTGTYLPLLTTFAFTENTASPLRKQNVFFLPQQIVAVMLMKGNIQSMAAQKGSTGIALLFFDLGTRWGG
jgi:hypothetical protein